MGRKGSVLIPFLEDGLLRKKYKNLSFEDPPSNSVFSLDLPHKKKNLNKECQLILKDWYKKRGHDNYRSLKDYTKAKQAMEAALRKSVFLQRIEPNNKKLMYKILSPEEVQAKRKLLKDQKRKASLEIDYNYSSSSIESSDYDSERESPVSSDGNHDDEDLLLAVQHDPACLMDINIGSNIVYIYDYVNELSFIERDDSSGNTLPCPDKFMTERVVPSKRENVNQIDIEIEDNNNCQIDVEIEDNNNCQIDVEIEDNNNCQIDVASMTMESLNDILTDFLPDYNFDQNGINLQQLSPTQTSGLLSSTTEELEFDSWLSNLSDISELENDPKANELPKTADLTLASYKIKTCRIYECEYCVNLPVGGMMLVCRPKWKELCVPDGCDLTEDLSRVIFGEATEKIVSSYVFDKSKLLKNDDLLVFLKPKELIA